MNYELSSNLPLLIPLVPAAAALLAYFLGRLHLAAAHLIAVLGSAAAFLLSCLAASQVMGGQVLVGINNELRMDGLSALMVVVISGIGLLATIYALDYMRHGALVDRLKIRGRLASFYGWYLLFLATMLWACVTNNIIMLYVAVEASTISSGLLVAFYADKRALEAGYKYLMLLTVGISFALFASVLIYAAAAAVVGGTRGLLISEIGKIAGELPRSVAIVAMALLVVGFGTKAGIAPFHPWLPDAHAEAPSAVSALLSGVMIKMAAYALVRTVCMFFPAYQPVGVFLVVLGVVTMLVGGIMGLAQADLKRLLAYSSVSQMGYLMIGFGFGTALGYYGALFHLVNHAIAKALLFLSVGAVIYATRGRSLNELGGLARVMPLTAACFLIGAFSLSGMPPFGGFMSKLTLYLAGAQVGMWWVVGVAMLTSLLTLIALLRAAAATFWGTKVVAPAAEVREVPLTLWAPMVVLAIAALALGVVPNAAYNMLHLAVNSLPRLVGLP
jgi:hydrogenase-4 component F